MLINRRTFLAATGLLTLAPSVSATQATRLKDVYHEVLLRHTRWAETQYDATAGRYRRTDFGFAVVLGNAVLLTRGGYDAALAGVEEDVLRRNTLATVRHFAASNVLAGGGEWGKTLFWDTTFQSYFVLAARLLWPELDAATRANVEAIARGQADYAVSLGAGNDPRSGGWSPNGLTGGYRGDTKLEEMGVYAQALAPGLAWHGDGPGWREAFGRWSRNEAGLPAADLANPAAVDGVPISANTATNLHDTFIVENHGSFGPHYQEELWRTSGRNAVHFLLAGRPLPEVLTQQPNGELLWRTILATMSDAGEPLMPMVDDREHLYGRDVIPLAFRSTVLRDPMAARAEAALASRLLAYQAHPPVHRLAKFSGEAKYEPEARAELAISYLLHELRPPVEPVPEQEFFARAAITIDHGAEPGLLTQQSAAAWAGTVTKLGFTKLAWQPAHDDWLFKISGTTPMLLPPAAVTGRHTATYRRIRDGFDATASLLRFADGFAGTATLPTGTIVCALPRPGRVDVHNLAMAGMPGLTGSRTYTGAAGSVTVRAREGFRVDELTFPATSARHVRMVGIRPHPTYGYSLFDFEVDGAAGLTASASSSDPGFEPSRAVDGDPATRWAVARSDRGRADSWLAVDLGATTTVRRVRLRWETAAAGAYRIETSADGAVWTAVAEYPRPDLSTAGWLDVDGRAGFVARSADPITVQGDTITVPAGVVEGYVRADLRAIAAQPAPQCPPAVRASTADGFLSLFNLSTEDVTATVRLPGFRLYRGTQVTTADGTEYALGLPAATARVEAPWFTARGVPPGITAVVHDARRVTFRGGPARFTLTHRDGGTLPVVLGRAERTVTMPWAKAYPFDDLALGRLTFPCSVLPPGMSDPAAAVDGSPRTAWTPGRDGRMVVDLGALHAIREVDLKWTDGKPPPHTVTYSVDGRTYGPATTARYVAVSTGWRPGHASLTTISVSGLAAV
ncbi:F5/8 type C domain-containing protein [Lentzea xinjiangensis]|uniref:F5/8 type C domain-containing protein n=1 Tax=Lentzea xinjiangensis TaxID=402600 RepID=A0A1H9REG8_9PSEU|nr:discoidin domain-containing protein [Lentzea xinjiangensis]SER71082.1 F5/8 type C domain-containing protein [Lentzea xinjiangensis]